MKTERINPKVYYNMSPQNFRLLSIGIILILVISNFMGCTLFNDDDEEEKREGFNYETLVETIPSTFATELPIIEPMPIINTSKPRPLGNVVVIWYFEKNTVYRDFGGTLKFNLQNNGTDNLYIYQIGIKPEWRNSNSFGDSSTSGIYSEVGKYVNATEKKYIGMIYFPGPSQSGEFKYSITFSAYSQNETGEWNDCGSQKWTTKTIQVDELPIPSKYKQYYNLPQYYDKINDVVDSTNKEVINLAHQLAGKFPGPFNIYQACAIFDYINSEIKYISDPSNTENYWSAPDQTLAYGGDCEDFSTLLASLIISIGGSVRMYLTDSHAFIGLYIGNETNIKELTGAIQNYYQTDLYLFWFEDNLGFWLIMDSSASVYLGGLPSGASPVMKNYLGPEHYSWTWDFFETENLYIVDVKPN